MRFELTEETAALCAVVDAILDERARADAVVASRTPSASQTPRLLWRELAGAGVVGALVGEPAGGLGLDATVLPPVFERLGASTLPVPAVETIAVAAPLLADAGHPALADVLSGATLVTAQLTDSPYVPYAGSADLFLLRSDDEEVRLYTRDQLDLQPVSTVDPARELVRVGEVHGRGDLMAAGPAAKAAWRRGVVGASSVLLGLADRMLHLTVAHVQTRRQFGVPIGSFQALKHRLADAYVDVEFARPAILAAAWADATAGNDADQQAAVAKVLASDAAVRVARVALQCHGAIGYTTEYELHLYMKRVWALARSWGDADQHRADLAAELGLR